MSDDTFPVLLRYAHISGEPLVAKHAAAAAGIAERTAYTRIAKAKNDLSFVNSGGNAGAARSSKDSGAFRVLLKYAEASGKSLQVKAAAKAAGIAERTAYTRIKQAKEEIEAAGGSTGAGAGVGSARSGRSTRGDSAVDEGLRSKTPESPTKSREGLKRKAKAAKTRAEADEDEIDTEIDERVMKRSKNGKKVGDVVKKEEDVEDGENAPGEGHEDLEPAETKAAVTAVDIVQAEDELESEW